MRHSYLLGGGYFGGGGGNENAGGGGGSSFLDDLVPGSYNLSESGPQGTGACAGHNSIYFASHVCGGHNQNGKVVVISVE